MTAPLAKQALAELVGTAALLCAVIGSGIMAERLAGGNVAVALLANTLATVFALYVLIETLGPVSGAHFNPLVTLVIAQKGALARTGTAQAAMIFIACQLAGAVLGAWLANAMFELPVLHTSAKLRGGTIRQVAHALFDRERRRLEAWVAPTFVPFGTLFSTIYGPRNAAVISCAYAGDIMLSGQGAGGDASAVAVIADVLAVARDRAAIVPAPVLAPAKELQGLSDSSFAEAV